MSSKPEKNKAKTVDTISMSGAKEAADEGEYRKQPMVSGVMEKLSKRKVQ